MWSVGCILAELLGGKPFFKGRDYVDQLNQILHYLGTPDESTLQRIGSPRAQDYVRNLPYMPKVDFTALFPGANPDALTLLDLMLAFDPSRRVAVEQALEHPYLAIWHDASDEPVCPQTFDFAFEVVDEVPEMRRMILDEVHRFRQHVREQPNAPLQQLPVPQGALAGSGSQGAGVGNQGSVPMPPESYDAHRQDPRPDLVQPSGQGGLEADLQGGLDAMHQHQRY